MKKQRLRSWINNFVEVSCEVSPDLYAGCFYGQAFIIVPEDIYQILKTSNVVFLDRRQTAHFLFVHSKGWKRLLEVRQEANAPVSTRLTLHVK